jgi:hypothetical protein
MIAPHRWRALWLLSVDSANCRFVATVDGQTAATAPLSPSCSSTLRRCATWARMRAAACASVQKRGGRIVWVAPPTTATEEIAMSESTHDRPDEADEQPPKPGEPDTETVAGQPRKPPESKDDEREPQQDD